MRQWLDKWANPATTAVAILLIYYAIPVDSADPLTIAINLPLSLLGIAILARAIIRQLRLHLDGDRSASVPSLLMLFILVIVVFALAYYALDQADPEQVAGLETRTDSLYFTLTTIATVGFGDIHAQGQVARVLVSLQIAFDVILVAALASLVSSRLQAATQAAREAGSAAADGEHEDAGPTTGGDQ